MEEKFKTWERKEKWLWVHRHRGKDQQVRERYYAIFKPWNATEDKQFPLGTNLNQARGKLARLRALNDARVEVILDEERERREALEKEQHKKRGMTVTEWAAQYFEKLAGSFEKRERTLDRERGLWDRLQPHFGGMALSEVKLTSISAYRVARERQVSATTCNRELAFLRYLLNLAEEEGVLEVVPNIRLKSEIGNARKRVLTPEECLAILCNMGREQQRYYIGLREGGMRLREPTKLTWDKIDLRNEVLRFAAADVKENWPRTTPITYEFREVLEELRREQTKIPNVGNRVFTRKNGKPIRCVREAWLKAVAEAVKQKKLPDDNVVPHDLRRTAITAWTAVGIPRDIVMACSGHKPNGVHDFYVNFTDAQLVEAFRQAGLMSPPAQRKQAKTA